MGTNRVQTARSVSGYGATMIPLKDTIRARTFPVVNVGIIALNLLVFFLELRLPPQTREVLLGLLGVVPERLLSPPILSPDLLTLLTSQIDDRTLILADVAEKAIRQVEKTVRGLVAERMAADAAAKLAQALSSGTWTHDYPIGVQEARQLGLPISTDMPLEVHLLMTLYPQASQRRPSVEYVPLPYGPRQPQAGRPAEAERSR